MTDKKNIVIKVKYPVPGRHPEEAMPSPKMITEWNVKRIALALGIVILMVVLPLYFYFMSPGRDDAHWPAALPEKVTGPEVNHDTAAESKKGTAAKSLSQDTMADTSPKPPELIKSSEADNAHADPLKTQVMENAGIKVNEAIKKQPVLPETKAVIKDSNSDKVVKAELSYRIINKNPVDIIRSTVKVGKAKAVWVNYFTELKGMNQKTIYHEWIKNGKVVSRHRLNISADRWRTTSRKPFNYTAEGHWHVRAVDEEGRILDQKEFNIVLDR